jgi:hypothetical protein
VFRSAQRADQEFYSVRSIPILRLPPDWNAIILPRKVGIGPVGARPF